ncbi:hypothetical protein LX36DRAFT_571667 [Colletotrichum falcatum]|nr:hypothetical protein LX36DRAFT_571667 [Colletotrichum falcatum]
MDRVQELSFAADTGSMLAIGGLAEGRTLNKSGGLPSKYQKTWRVSHAASGETMGLFGASFPLLGSVIANAQLRLVSRHLLILDEAYKVKNHKRETHLAALSLPCDAFMGVTGTFMPNKWMDVYGLIEFLPGNPFDSFENFVEWFEKSPVMTKADT